MKKSITILTIATLGGMAHAETANDSLNLNEVVVTGTRNATDTRHLPMTVSVINRDRLTVGQQSNVLPTVMQQVPGMFVTSRGVMGYGVSTGGSGGISVRGLSGGAGQAMVLIDGHPQYNGVYGHPISDSYQTLMAERVEVVRGPASVLYGSNAMGGVMNIITRKTKKDGVFTDVSLGAGSYGTAQAEVSNQIRKGGFFSTVAAQYSRTDNHRPNMGFEQYGGYIKLGYDFSQYWSAYIDLDLTHFNASNPGTVSVPKAENDQYITRGAASLVVENHYGKTSGAISIYDNFGIHKINDGYNINGGTPQTDLFRSKDAVAGFSLWQSISLFQGNNVTAGFDYQNIYGNAYYTNRETGERVTTPKRKMRSARNHEDEYAGYVDFRQDLAQWLTIDAGVRYDYHTVAGGEWIPQGGIIIRPVATGELKAFVSKGFRNPTTKEMYLYGSANHETLRAERMWNYELSWRQRLGSLNYGANVFYINADNLIQTVAGKNINTGELKNWGFEFDAAYRFSQHFSVNTNHSFLGMKKKVIAAPEYKGFIGADYTCGKWTANAGVMYLNGLYTSADDKQNVCLVNASVAYRLTKWLQLWARGENLLAQSYEINAGYPMPRATFMGGVNLNF